MLINNAGIVSFSQDRKEEFQETFATNVIGPAIVTEAFVELLKKSSDPRLLYVSSGLGSIGLRYNAKDPYYGLDAKVYRTSKAAVNMLAACDLANFREWKCKVWAYDPGYVITNLTGEGDRERRKAQGAGSPETSAAGILKIVKGERDAEIGSFLERETTWPW